MHIKIWSDPSLRVKLDTSVREVNTEYCFHTSFVPIFRFVEKYYLSISTPGNCYDPMNFMNLKT